MRDIRRFQDSGSNLGLRDQGLGVFRGCGESSGSEKGNMTCKLGFYSCFLGVIIANPTRLLGFPSTGAIGIPCGI